MIESESRRPAPKVFELIPEKDYLVISAAGDLPLPDHEELEELCIQADQRCAPPTLGPAADAILTLAELVAGGLATNAATAGYPALRAYLGRLLSALHRSDSEAQPETPIGAGASEAVVSEVEQAVGAAVGGTATELSLAPADTDGLQAVVKIKNGALVDIRADLTGMVVSITIRDA